MTGRSKHRSNTTGKAGNDSGSRRREARGEAAGRTAGGKHPPNRIFTTPQTQKKQRARVATAYRSRASDRG